MAQPGGEAQSYYNDAQPPPGPPPNQQKGYAEGYGQQAPPQYGTSYGPQGYEATGEKMDFNQTFKVDKPKWNDLWAGVLFIAVFAGFTAVSGIAIEGYASTKGFQGGGIYDSR